MIRRAVKNVFGMTNVAEHSKGEKNTLRTAFKGCTMYISCVCMHDFGSIYHVMESYECELKRGGDVNGIHQA